MPSFLFICATQTEKIKKLLFYFYFIFSGLLNTQGGSERRENALRAGEYCYECTARGDAKTPLTGSALRCPHGQQKAFESQ